VTPEDRLILAALFMAARTVAQQPLSREAMVRESVADADALLKEVGS
jgi:hypothetical protein